MGNLKRVFDSIGYAIAILLLLFVAAVFLGMLKEFSPLFSFSGFVVMAFLVFTSIAK